MMHANKNMILKQSVNFHISGKVDGLAIQQDVTEWCRDVLNPSIDETLVFYEQKDKVILFNNISLDISVDTAGNWKDGLKEKILNQLKEKLHSKITVADETVVIKTLTDDFSEVIHYYMKHGILPWHTGIKTRKYLEEALNNWVSTASPAAIKQFALNIPDEKAALRFVDLVSRDNLELFLAVHLAKEVTFIAIMLEDIRSFANFITGKQLMQQWMIKFFSTILLPGITIEDAMLKWFDYIEAEYPGQILKLKTKKISNAEIKKITGELQIKLLPKIKDTRKEKPGTNPEELSQKEVVKSISKKEAGLEEKSEKRKLKKKKESAAVQASKNKPAGTVKNNVGDVENKDAITTDDEFNKALLEGIYIDNAGAVIIAPFLNSLFSRAGLLNGNDINDINSALMLLHYCVTGNTTAAEFELFFPKILCGISAEKAVATNILLSEKQLAEADEMLLSVIEYWAVIKNTSIPGLRESFLKRSGKLTMVNNEWLLQVEQKPYDMLLQQLPWSISMIKLPWMKNLLKTDWI